LPHAPNPAKNFAGEQFVGLAVILFLIVFAWRINVRVKRAARAAEQARPYPIPPWQPEKAQRPASAQPSQQPGVVYWNGTPTALAWSSGPQGAQRDQRGSAP
jgi:hypothetical protein